MEANVLTRSLLETAITAYWILREPEQRLPMFNDSMWNVYKKFNRTIQNGKPRFPKN